jgi:hypothetical protein
MTQVTQGKVISVNAIPTGDEADIDHAIGVSTLFLRDVSDFAEEGGQIRLALSGSNVDVYYTGKDEDLATLTLTIPTLVAVPEDTPIYCLPISEEKWAMVDIEEGDDPISARIPHTMSASMSVGIREESEQETVLVDNEDEPVLIDVIAKTPVIQGGYLIDVPGVSDDPATVSPDPTVIGGIKVLHVVWDPVGGTDVKIQVHMSTNPALAAVFNDATTMVGNFEGTGATIDKLPLDGSELEVEYDIDSGAGVDMQPRVYYVQTIAFNDLTPSGAPPSAVGSGSLRKITTPDISAEAAWVGTMSADRLRAGTLDVTMDLGVGGNIVATGATGARVGMSGGDGFFVKGGVDLNYADLVLFPTNGKPNIVSGTLRATTLEVEGDPVTGKAATFRRNSALEVGATILLNDKVNPPVSAPSFTIEWDHLQLYVPPSPEAGKIWVGTTGGSWHGGYFYTIGMLDSGNRYLLKLNMDGTSTGYASRKVNTGLRTGQAVPLENPKSMCIVTKGDATVWAVIACDDLPAGGDGPGTVHALKFGAIPLATMAAPTWVTKPDYAFGYYNPAETGPTAPYTYGDNDPYNTKMAVGADGVNVWVAYGKHNVGVNDGFPLTFRKYDPFTAAAKTAEHTSTTQTRGGGVTHSCRDLYVGVGDYGDGITRYILGTGSKFLVHYLSGTMIQRTDDEWVSDTTQTEGIGFDGTNFWSSRDDGNSYLGILPSFELTKYTGIIWSTAAGGVPDSWSLGYTFYDSGANSETTISPLTAMPMTRRAKWRVTTSTSPSGGARIYIGRGKRVNCSTTASSPTLGGTGFTVNDVGATVIGTGIPAGTKVLAYVNATTLTMDKNATLTNALVTLSIGPTNASMWRQDPALSGGVISDARSTVATSGNIPQQGSIAFAVGTSAQIYSQATDTESGASLPSITLRGDGYARIKELFAQRVLLQSTTDATVNAGNLPPLRIGNPAGTHLRIDGNEILAMSGDTGQGVLFLNQGGNTKIGTGTSLKGFDHGEKVGNANASGQVTVNHGLGVAPTAVVCTSRNAHQIRVFSAGSASFIAEMRTAAGAVVANGTTCTFDWIAVA